MFTIETIGKPITSGLRVSSTSVDGIVFFKCLYDQIPTSGIEYAGLEETTYIDGVLEHFASVEKIYVVSFCLVSDRWNETQRWIAWRDTLGFKIACKDITDLSFSVVPPASLLELSADTLAKAGSSELSISLSMNECHTLTELVNRLGPIDLM